MDEISGLGYRKSLEFLIKDFAIYNNPEKEEQIKSTWMMKCLKEYIDNEKIKTLAEILGHKNPTVTLNRYAHSLMEHKADMMNRLGKLL